MTFTDDISTGPAEQAEPSSRGQQRPPEPRSRADGIQLTKAVAEPKQRGRKPLGRPLLDAVESAGGSLARPLLLLENNVTKVGSDEKSPLAWETPVENWANRIARYERAKQRGDDFGNWLAVQPDWSGEMQKLAGWISRCNLYQTWRHVLDGDHAGRRFLHRAFYCQKPQACQVCAIRRGAAIMQKDVPRVCDHVLRGGMIPLVGLMSVPNCEDLEEAITSLKQGQRAFFARMNKGKYKTELNKLAGGRICFEVKRGKNSKAWHPHAHFIFLATERVDWLAICTEWNERAGGVMKLREPEEYTRMRQGRLTPSGFKTSFPGAMCEIAKYPLKFSDLSFEDNYHVYETLRRMRVQMTRTFGCMRGSESEEAAADRAPFDWQTVQYAEMILRYDEECGRYVRNDGGTMGDGSEGVPF